MDQAELRDRLRQELAKRTDVVLARVGYDFAPRIRISIGEKPARFFFAPESVDSILALLCQRFPDYKRQVLERADRICSHRFDLLGYRDLDYGHPIDWHLDAVHRKRAPKKASYRVRYLDFAEAGDSKVTWEPNRHQHLVTLAKAYRLTREPRYADEALRQWRHWREANPYAVGINWASSLEVAFRALSWAWVYYLLQGVPEVPDFRRELLRPLALHGRHMERFLSTYFSPNTHLLGEGVGLFFLGVLFPELSSAERWKSLGKEIVLQEARRQVCADGFHFEQSTYYHVYAIDFFLHTALLAAANEIPLPEEFEDTIEKMLNVLSLLARQGPPPRFGDDDGGRLFDPQRNGTEHLLDPLATGAILFQRGDFKAAAGGLREETIWLLGAEGVRQWDALQPAEISKESVALPESGFYLLSAEKSQLVVNTGPQGNRSGGHGHADALSITLQSRGQSLLIDPGTFEYIGPGGDRELFRGTLAHNTVTVDEMSQADPAGPFSWQQAVQSRVERWIQGQNFDLLVASHEGYSRLAEPVTHFRWIICIKSGVYFVRDVVLGQEKHRLDIPFHLAPNLEDAGNGTFRVKDSDVLFRVAAAEMEGWRREVRPAVWSPAYGRKSPTTVLNFAAEVPLPAEFAVLLTTSEPAGEVGTLVRLEKGGLDSREASAFKDSARSEEFTFIFGVNGGVSGRGWRTGSISSDAEFVCRSRKLGASEEHWILCGGSYAKTDEGLELRCSRPVEWAEWVRTEDSSTVYSSDMAAVGEPASLRQTGAAPARTE